MRFRSIRFEPFGALRGVDLDFGDLPGRLHVVWGPNEAGKSTALRGIVGFLFGIARDTADQHERGVELRVRARIATSDGGELDLVRRKGTKDPLRDGATDAGVPERVLSRWLGGIDEATFRQLHALDHVTLRAGGESILRGQGRLGELMLEATTGATGIADRLQALRDEANALYRPRAKSTDLQVAVEAWKAAVRAMGQASLAPAAWHEQERGIAATRARIAEADQKLKDVRVELGRLERLVALDDPLARLRHRRARRAQLGEVADIPEGTAARRDELLHELSTADEEADRADADLSRLALEREAAATRAAAVDPGFDRGRAVEHRAAIDSLSRSRAEAEAELGEISRAREEILEALGDPHDGVPWTDRAIDARDLARIQTRAAELRAARAGVEAAERSLGEADARRAATSASEPEAAGDPESIAALASAIAAGRRATTAAASLDALVAREIELVRRLAPSLAATGARDLRELASIRVPDPTTLDAEARERAADAAAIAAAVRDRDGALERAARAAADLAALLEGPRVPAEADLTVARRERNGAFERARRAIDAGAIDGARAALGAAENAALAADVLADQLRREAARVEQLAAKEAERQSAMGAADALAARAAALREAATERATGFGRAWPSVAALPIEAARAWIGARTEAIAAGDELAATRTRAEDLRAELATARDRLKEVGIGSDEAASRAAVEAGVAAAEIRLLATRERARRREEAIAARARAEADREAAARALDHAKVSEEAARRTWMEALEPHRLGAPATIDEAVAAAVALASATRETRRHARATVRVERLRADLEREEAVWRSAVERAGLADVAADEILDRAERAREARAELPRIEDAIAQRRDVAARARARSSRARTRLDEILTQAGVPSERLLVAEERARDARSLAREIATLEATLVEMTGAADLASAEAHVRDVDFAKVATDAEQLLRDVEELEASRARDLHDAGAQQVELDEMERGRGTAADLAEAAEAHLARARELARRTAVARAAVALLERELEKHRAEREGPVLRRASELFRIMTAAHWDGLRVGESDKGEPEIRAFRGATELGADGLSEGARDQLYFALRLAALEHHASVGVAPPLILDDVLVHSDEERTEAALRALAEVAKTVQVLLFTHERHVAEIARRVLGPDAVAVHELSRTP